MCFRWLVEAELRDIHQISFHELGVQKVLLHLLGLCLLLHESSVVLGINSDMMVPGLTLIFLFFFLGLYT